MRMTRARYTGRWYTFDMDVQPALPPEARCIDCKYALRGLHENRCPECGRGFDPADRSTFLCGPTMGSWRSLARPPSVVECAVASILGLIFVCGSSSPAYLESPLVFFATCLGGPLFGMIVLAYVIRLFLTFEGRREIRFAPAHSHRHPRRRWCYTPFVILIVGSVFVYPWPLVIRFLLSRSAFHTAVVQIQSGQFVSPCYVGLYYVENAALGSSASDDGVQFICGSSIIDPVGFEFSGSAPFPPKSASSIQIPLTPFWRTIED